MRCSLATAALLTALIPPALGQGNCPNAQQIGGNWYCGAVKSITYNGFPRSGSYKGVASMGKDGQCEFKDVPFDGPFGPFGEELSVHVRGPVQLKKLAVYTGGGASKRSLSARHPHGGAALAARAGGMSRAAYYDAAAGTAEGLVFLNHKGGQGSGVFDNVNGNSLSYANADASSGAASPQVLSDAQLGDNSELTIMSDKKCGDSDCGAVRPGTVAHHGWGGNDKAFVAELSMPATGKQGFNADMPSLWLLNAAIPRTNQYGDCSCWKGGCGELDILEVLDSGNTRCKSTVHAVASGGDSNYFERPTDKTVHVATVFDGGSGSVTIKLLDSFDYGGSLGNVDELTKPADPSDTFTLGG
ncbi:target of Sbf [Ascosphaera acerosa]|nr:target of Sbf [Ascosphaera acerosa]